MDFIFELFFKKQIGLINFFRIIVELLALLSYPLKRVIYPGPVCLGLLSSSRQVSKHISYLEEITLPLHS